MDLITKITSSKFLFTGIGLGEGEEPFSTEAGEVFKSVLSSVDVNPNLIEFRKSDFDDETITPECMEQFHQFLSDHSEIEYIVFLGRNVVTQVAHSISKSLKFNVLNSMGFLPAKELGGKRAACIFHPKYVLNLIKKKDEDILRQYTDRINSLVYGDNKKSEYEVNINTISMDEFLENVAPEVVKQDVIGIDYETNGAPIFNVDFKITIVSISINPVGSNQLYSWWIDWTTVNDKNLVKYQEFIESIKDKLWAYNCTFEIQVNWRIFNKFIPIQDAMILMTMNGTRSSLKVAVRRYLHTDFWETEVGDYRDKFEEVFKVLTNGKKGSVQFNEIKDIPDYNGIMNYLIEHKFPASILNNLKELSDLYGEDEVFKSFHECPYEWGAVPRDVLGPYCCYDSAYTIPLVRMFYDKYKDGYPIYIRHAWMSTKFLANGIRWDDAEAEKQYNFYINKMNECLYNVIKGLTSTISVEDQLSADQYKNAALPTERIWYTESGQERRVPILNELDRLNSLKCIFNPNSNTDWSRNKFWSVYYTSEIEIASFAFILISELRLKGVWDNYIAERLHNKEVPDGVNAESWFIKSLDSGSNDSASNLIEDVMKYAEDKGGQISELINLAMSATDDSYKSATYGRYASEVVNTQYEIHKTFLGLNIDDPSTWNNEFRLLYNLQLYKKIYKLIGASINGITGRYNVSEVDNFEHEPPIRRGWWDGYKENQQYVLSLDFNCLSVATHRWSSGFHTVPAGSPVRKIFRPRRDDGVWLHMDYSQAELVILAFFSQDPAMMNVYLNRGDMHRYIASKIFEKAPEDITSDERRASKSVEFGIIYGKSVENTAVEVTGGDVAKAQALFDAFYEAFPGIKSWMQERRVEVDKYGKVSNLFGGMIEIDTTQPGNAKYRQAINYPIQSTSSMLAGVGMYQFIEACENQGIPQVSYGFTHDSLDISTQINYLFELMDTAYEHMEKRIYRELGAPMHIDIEVGVNAYSLVELEYSKLENNQIKLELTGIEDDVVMLLDKFSKYSKWEISEFKELKEKVIKTSWADMFGLKSAFKDTWGTTKVKKSFELKLSEK